MSREQKLSKKIAHTLLAMSIVYSGGMNVLCNTAFAAGKGADGADKKENVTVTELIQIPTPAMMVLTVLPDVQERAAATAVKWSWSSQALKM